MLSLHACWGSVGSVVRPTDSKNVNFLQTSKIVLTTDLLRKSLLVRVHPHLHVPRMVCDGKSTGQLIPTPGWYPKKGLPS